MLPGMRLDGRKALVLGLASGIGAAIARMLAEEGATLTLLGRNAQAAELETLARLRLPMLVVVFNDAAYGAEVHHFGPQGRPLELVRFPDTDFAALARAAGAQGVTARTLEDLDAVGRWLGQRDGPLVLDAKITPDFCAEWLEEAFK